MGENMLAFLYEATKVLPKNDCGKFIRCQLMAKMHRIKNINQPAQNFKPSVMCQTCGIQLFDVPPKVSIKTPQKTNRIIRRVLKKVERNEKLSIYQKGIFDSYQRKNQQKMITVCKSCKKTSITEIDKPTFIFTPNKATNQINTRRSLKRKRKKDMYSGLNKYAVLSVLPTQENETVNIPNQEKNSNILKNKNYTHNMSNLAQNSKSNLVTEDNVDTQNYFVCKTGNKPVINQNSAADMSYIPLVSGKNSYKNKNLVVSNKTGVPLLKNTNKNMNNNTLRGNKNKDSPNNNKKPKKKKKNKIQFGRIEKNEVLKKTEKNLSKGAQIRKQLTSILQEKQKSTSSLNEFLKFV